MIVTMVWKRFALVEENCSYAWFESAKGEPYFLTKSEYRRLNNPPVLETRTVRKKDSRKYPKEVA